MNLHNAKTNYSGSGVAPQTPIPLFPIGKQRCFWIPGIGVFIFFLGIVQFKYPHPRYPKKYLLAYREQRRECLGRHPKSQIIFIGIVQFKHPRQRYPKALVLAYRVQWYGCLGCRPRTETLFCGFVPFKHPHPRYPKTPLLAYRE